MTGGKGYAMWRWVSLSAIIVLSVLLNGCMRQVKLSHADQDTTYGYVVIGLGFGFLRVDDDTGELEAQQVDEPGDGETPTEEG